MNVNRNQRWHRTLAVCLLLLPAGRVVVAQDASSNLATAELQLETIKLKDATEYTGLLQSKTDDEIEFVEIFLRPGMPMSATVHVISPSQVKRYESLPEDRRRILAEHVHRLRYRLAIEAGNQQQVPLVAAPENSRHDWEHSGEWFHLTSTADEESTRRCIVRIEQVFRAFRQLIPPTEGTHRPLRIVLYGSVDEYQTVLRTLGIEIDNLAFYASRENTIFAGAELTNYGQQLRDIHVAHQKLLRDSDTIEEQFKTRLKTYSEKLAAQGFNREQIKEEMARRNAAWNRERLLLERQISETDRRNDAAFAEVTDRMFRRLGHEAFHAYLADYVLADQTATIDRWLNEGLAQIFEVGQLDGDMLRLDAPNTAALALLQRDLASTDSLSLSDLIASADQDFVTAHAQFTTARNYAYAWGLAYYLAIDRQLISPKSLATFQASPDGAKLERFEALIGKPIHEFELEWRNAMLSLSLP